MCWMQGKNYNIFNVLLKQSGDAINQSMALMHVSNDTLAKRVFLLSFPIKTKTIALALCVWGWYYFWLRSKPLNKQTINLAVFLFNQEPRPLYYWTWLAGGLALYVQHTQMYCVLLCILWLISSSTSFIITFVFDQEDTLKTHFSFPPKRSFQGNLGRSNKACKC